MLGRLKNLFDIRQVRRSQRPDVQLNTLTSLRYTLDGAKRERLRVNLLVTALRADAHGIAAIDRRSTIVGHAIPLEG